MLLNSLRRVTPLKAALRAHFSASADALQKGANDSYTTFRTAYVAQQQKMRDAL
jgi:ABC-type transporter lipoprotein component MlaA